jgi:hypothetical protein
MIGPLTLGDLLVIYAVVLVIYIVLTELELIEFRKTRKRFNSVFGEETSELEKEEYILLNEIKSLRKLVEEIYTMRTGRKPIIRSTIPEKQPLAKPPLKKPPLSKTPLKKPL